jgi:serine/threonine protein kinase
MATPSNSSLGLTPDDSARLAPFVYGFEDTWQQGERPVLDDYLPAEGDDRRLVLVRLVPMDLERRLKAGEPTRVEEYLTRYPVLGCEKGLVVELLTQEYKLRRAREPGLSLDEYARRFPAHVQELRKSLDAPETDIASTLPQGQRPRPPDEEGPTTIGRYRIIEHLGSGGQADVFRAAHPTLPGRDVVIKWLRRSLPKPEGARLVQEGRVLASLDDPGVVRVYDVDEHAGRTFIVLEHIAGRSLQDYLQQRPLPTRQAAALVADLARTLARVHVRGVLHLDLKPANVLLDVTGRPRLLDFGLAWANRTWTGPAEREESICGTLAYMAPEVANGEIARIGPATDVFGLGAVLYHLLTGRPPYHGDNQAIVWQQAKQGQINPPRRVNPAIPRRLERICLKALAVSPDDRYASARDLGKAIHSFLRRRLVGALVTAGILLSALVTTGIFLKSKRATIDPRDTFPPVTKEKTDLLNDKIDPVKICDDADKAFVEQKYDLAKSLYRRALELHPGFPRARTGLDWVFDVQEEKEWVKICDDADEALPEQKYEQAKLLYERALQLNPRSPRALTNLGRVFDKKHNHEQAIRLFTEAIERDPAFVNAYLYRAQSHYDHKEYADAIADCDEALRRSEGRQPSRQKQDRLLSLRAKATEAKERLAR